MTWMTSDEFVTFYAEALRGPLFSAFLALGGFLFSMKTFVLVKMKEGVYDTDQYHDLVMDRRALNQKHSFYGGLRRFSCLLMWASCSCLVAAVVQFTIGLVPALWASIVSLAACFVAVALLVWSIGVSYLNLSDWFERLEEEARELEKVKLERAKSLDAGNGTSRPDDACPCPYLKGHKS